MGNCQKAWEKMEKVRKSKGKPSLDSILFSTPEQKMLRFLLSEPTTSFTLRILSSRLKGIRGLGGAEGIMNLLRQLEEVGLVQFLNNNREISIQNDNLAVKMMKILSSICDLEGVRELVEPISTRGVLFGSRANGECRSDSNYNVFVVSDSTDSVRNVVERHPLGKKIELEVWTSDQYHLIEKKNSRLSNHLTAGIVMWGSSW